MKRDIRHIDTASIRPIPSNQVLDVLLHDLLAEVQPDDDAEDLNTSVRAPICEERAIPKTVDRCVDERLPAQVDWAQSVFSVLKFQVGHTEWAAPLVLLECVAQVPETLTVLPGQPAIRRPRRPSNSPSPRRTC